MKKYVHRKFLDNQFRIYFTPQEVKCIICFLQGFTYKRTAETVGIAIGTVSFYATNMRAYSSPNRSPIPV